MTDMAELPFKIAFLCATFVFSVSPWWSTRQTLTTEAQDHRGRTEVSKLGHSLDFFLSKL